MNTSLDNLFKLQAGLMLALGVEVDRTQRPGIGDISKEAATGLVLESAEVLEAITKMHRAWKPDGDDTTKLELATEEAIDVLFYLIEMFISLGVENGEALMELVHRKRAIVLGRIVAAAYEKKGEAVLTPQFEYALAELKRYVPRIEEDPISFREDPYEFVHFYFDLKHYNKMTEGKWTLPF